MPSANKTPLGLNQWQANEYPKMADFNEDNRIIDEKITELQSGSGVKIYTVAGLTDPVENKIYNVKIEENTSTINEKPVYKENTSESVTLKAGKVATVYYQGGNFFYKANASGDALAEHVLAGKTFSNDDDTDVVGAMVNHGAKIFKPSTANIIIPKGFHNGTGYVEGDPNLVSGNIVQGKQIFGVDGSALEYTAKQKEDIANAITSKGVPTSTTASWEIIEKNIKKIKPYPMNITNKLQSYKDKGNIRIQKNTKTIDFFISNRTSATKVLFDYVFKFSEIAALFAKFYCGYINFNYSSRRGVKVDIRFVRKGYENVFFNYNPSASYDSDVPRQYQNSNYYFDLDRINNVENQERIHLVLNHNDLNDRYNNNDEYYMILYFNLTNIDMPEISVTDFRLLA